MRTMFKISAMCKLIPLVIPLVLHGCAAVHQDGVSHEGGIVGTGERVDCNLEQNKKLAQCLNKLP